MLKYVYKQLIKDAVHEKQYGRDEALFAAFFSEAACDYVLSFLNEHEEFAYLDETERKIFFLFVAESIS